MHILSINCIKRIAENGSEFWCARELAPVLEYAQQRNFAKVIDKAMIACSNSGYDTGYHFAEVSKMIFNVFEEELLPFYKRFGFENMLNGQLQKYDCK